MSSSAPSAPSTSWRPRVNFRVQQQNRANLLPPPHQERIERRPLPPLLHVVGARDGKMQMRCCRICVSCRSNIAKQFAFLYRHSSSESGAISIEMRVEHDESLRRVGHVDRETTSNTVVKLEHQSRISGQYRRSSGRHDVEGFMMTRTAAQVVEAVDQLVGRDALSRDDQAVRLKCSEICTRHWRK